MELEVRVSPSGSALDVSVVSSSGSPSLDRAALGGVRRAHFAPAMHGSQPVEATTRVSVVFSLDD